MKSKRQFPIIFGLVVVLSGALLLFTYYHSNPSHVFFEPHYQDEPLSYWVQNLYRYDRTRHLNVTSAEALRHLGKDALPLLVDWISRPEPTYFRPGNIEYQRLAVDAFEILGPIAKPAIPDLMKNVEKGSYHSMRALKFIGQDAVPALTNKLSETLADKRKALLNWRDPGYKKNFFHVQALIVQGLGEMGTNAESAIPVLKRALYADHGWRPEVSPHSALVSVGSNQPAVVIPTLLDALTNSSAPALNRGLAAAALTAFGTKFAAISLPPLITAMGDAGTDQRNHPAIANALAVVGQSHPELVIPVLINAFKRSPQDFQGGIASAMAMFGNNARPAIPLLETASKSQNFYLRQKAAIAVKTIAPENTNALASLIRDLNNHEPGLRQQTIYALGRLGTNAVEAAPALLKCLSHPYMQTRIDAIRALNDIGVRSDEFILALGDNLAAPNGFTAGVAGDTLADLASSSKLAFVTLLKKALTGSVTSEVRNQAKYRLVDISRENPIFMLECLEDADPLVRSGALILFYNLPQDVPAAVPKLRQLSTNDPDPDVRSRAADVLRLQTQN